jgi:hypothetical protein
LLGGAKTGPTFAFGSSPTMSGLKIARKTKTARMPTATSADLFRRTGAAMARHLSERVGDGASSACGAPVWTGLTRSLLSPAVEPEVQEVGEQVEEDHRQREQEERRLQHRVVALVDRLDDEEPDAGYEKTYSTVIAPPMMKPSESATSVMIGSIALRSPCFHTVDQFESPSPAR